MLYRDHNQTLSPKYDRAKSSSHHQHRHYTLSIMIGCMISFSQWGCDQNGSGGNGSGGSVEANSNPIPNRVSGYGAEGIGLKGSAIAEEIQTQGASRDNSQSLGDAAPSAESEDVYYDPEAEIDPTPMELEPEYSAMITSEELANLQTGNAQWGFVFEGLFRGQVSSLIEESWLSLGDLNLDSGLNISNDADLVEARARFALGTSSEFSGPIQYQESLTVVSRLELELPNTASALMSISRGAQTVVTQETYQSNNGSTSLREICLIAESDADASGETLYGTQTDELINDTFVSLASVTDLSEITDDSATLNETSSALLGVDHQLTESEARCQCFDEDGVSAINCELFDRTLDPNLPVEIPFYETTEAPLSTFSLDVDTASYTRARQALTAGARPDPYQIRIEEMINYFNYNYEIPRGEQPFTVYTEVADCPWSADRKLAMIGIRGQEITIDDQPPANLVYLLDVSGSMRAEMQLIKPAFRLLTNQLRPEDTLSIVVYAGRDAVILEGASGDDTEEILAAIDTLESGGGTNGEMGIRRAYQIATEHFKPGGNNRVILATDGDFNVGIRSPEALVNLIEEEAESGVFLTVYGFSTGYVDSEADERMEELSNRGNGTYFFIDGSSEAQRAFMHSLSGTLLTIAKDVKVQVQFNPEIVSGYRLIGYDNRRLNNRDFNNDSVDAGELGNGEEMTAFYEIILADTDVSLPIAEGQYIPPARSEVADELNEELMTVRMRYKLPNEDESSLFITPVSNIVNARPSLKFTFAAAVTELGLALRQSSYLPSRDLSDLSARLDALGESSASAVTELRNMIELTRALDQ